MLKLLKTFLVTLACLVALDFAVAGGLHLLSGHRGAGPKLVQFFDYGRSVPGKLREWMAHPDMPGNLFEVAWRKAMMKDSAARFAKEDPTKPEVRGYSLSFVDHILQAAAKQDPGLIVDLHAAPAAPPNATYAMFLDDRPNRRRGDIDVLGIFSDGVYAMSSLSNQTWSFEQPSPFTYPVFLPTADGGLKRIEPTIETATQERTVLQNPSSQEATAWRGQLGKVDPFFMVENFGFPWLDVSPFARLVRRSLAVKSIQAEKARLLADPDGASLPYGEILRRMVVNFDRIATEDGQLPVVVLVQVRGKPDLRALLVPTLKAHGIRYLATADYQDPTDSAAYVPDGHYKPEIRARFGRAFLKVIGAPATP